MASNTTTVLKCFRCCNTSTNRNFLKYLGIPQSKKENNNYTFLKENFTDSISFPGTEQELGICAKCAYELFNDIVSSRPETQLVTFDANNGTVSPTSKTYPWGTIYKSFPTPERENYVFNGWWTELEDGEQITISSIVTNSATLTLYAHWVAE